MGLLSSSHSLRFIFSEEEEEMLVLICIVYAHQGSPLTVDAFHDLASFLAGRDEFSRYFVMMMNYWQESESKHLQSDACQQCLH